MHKATLNRRQFGIGAAVASAALCLDGQLRAEPAAFRLNYVLASPMYGTAPLAEVLAEVKPSGAQAVDIWPRPHANHREQVAELGWEKFGELLQQRGVQLGLLTRYDLGPYGLQDELHAMQKLGGQVVVTGARGATGATSREQVRAFVESLRPHVAVAEELGIKIGIENHSRSLIESPESIRYFAECAKSPHLGIALAPYHLPQESDLIAKLIVDLGDSLVHFQAWQYGHGCMTKLPKEEELLQMPGRGELDFTPLLKSLQTIRYRGYTEIFMHPTPRGIPILETTTAVTAEINRARAYLEQCLSKL